MGTTRPQKVSARTTRSLGARGAASRAGCVFLNESDIVWRPYVLTWVETMGDQKAQTILEGLFEQFVAPTLSMLAKEKWKVKCVSEIVAGCRRERTASRAWLS